MRVTAHYKPRVSSALITIDDDAYVGELQAQVLEQMFTRDEKQRDSLTVDRIILFVRGDPSTTQMEPHKLVRDYVSVNDPSAARIEVGLDSEREIRLTILDSEESVDKDCSFDGEIDFLEQYAGYAFKQSGDHARQSARMLIKSAREGKTDGKTWIPICDGKRRTAL